MKFKSLFLSLFLLFPAIGFEINTHQAITSCALSTNCITLPENQGAQNLNYFALTMQLNNNKYDTQVFERYEPFTYFKYASEGKGLGEASTKQNESHIGKQINFTDGKTYLKGATDENGNITNFIDYSNTSFISLIEAGSILEDAIFPISDNAGDGRFNNHFYSAQFSYPAETPYFGDTVLGTPYSVILGNHNIRRKSDRASLAEGIADAYGQRTDNISWALDESIAFNVGTPHIHTRKNDTNLRKAFESSKKHTPPFFASFVPAHQQLNLEIGLFKSVKTYLKHITNAKGLDA